MTYITSDNIIKALEQWITNDLVSKGNSWQQALTYLVVIRTKSKMNNLIPALDMLSDSEHKFNFEQLVSDLNNTLVKAGNKIGIPVINYIFDKQDLDKLITYFRSYISNE